MSCLKYDTIILFTFSDSLYALLMELAVNNNSSATSEGESLTSLACACLASLVVARGNTGKYMQATSALLMSPSSLISQSVKVGLGLKKR